MSDRRSLVAQTRAIHAARQHPTSRPMFDRLDPDLPNATQDHGAYLHELRRRMRAALRRYGAVERQLELLETWYLTEMGPVYGAIQLDEDREVRTLAALRNVMRERARTYAVVIAAEVAIDGHIT